MNPFIKYFAIAGAAVAVLFLVYQKGSSAGVNSERQKWLIEQASWNNEAMRLADQLRQREKEHKELVYSIEEKHLTEVKHIEQAKDDIINELRDGNLKLRKRFQRSTNNTESRDTTTASNSDAAGEGGLSRNDAEFLVRFAAQCDANTRQLISAQEYIKSLELL